MTIQGKSRSAERTARGLSAQKEIGLVISSILMVKSKLEHIWKKRKVAWCL